ncbi:MAG: phage major capsid protein [Candidatus Moraniibacteriota bacterium]
MNLKELLKKLLENAAGLSVEEKAFLASNEDSMSDVEKEAFAKVAVEEEEGIDKEALKALVGKSIEDALAGRVDKISDQIVAKFQKGVNAARAKVLDGVEEEEEKKDEKAKGFATREFLKALMNGDKARAKAVTTDDAGAAPDDTKAGLLIPDELRTEVLRIKETQYGLARREMFYLPFSGPGNSRTIPALGTSVTVKWTDEKGKKKSTQPKFSVITQTLKKLAAIVPFTEEILEDSAIDIVKLVGELFAEATAKEEDLQFFAGTGSPWTGILNNGSVNIVTMLTGEANDNLADELLRMQDATPSGAQDGAKYFMHRSWLNRIRKMKSSTGDYVYTKPSDGQPAMIWDKPVVLSDAFPSTADVQVGDPFVLYGNLKQAAVFGDKQQLRVKLLDQATITDTDDSTIINLAEQDMVALRVVERVGYTVALAAAATVLKYAEES